MTVTPRPGPAEGPLQLTPRLRLLGSRTTDPLPLPELMTRRASYTFARVRRAGRSTSGRLRYAYALDCVMPCDQVAEHAEVPPLLPDRAPLLDGVDGHGR